MIASIEAQRASMAAARIASGEEWDTITLHDTLDGQPYHDVENHRGYSCWRLMVKIPKSRTYKSLPPHWRWVRIGLCFPRSGLSW